MPSVSVTPPAITPVDLSNVDNTLIGGYDPGTTGYLLSVDGADGQNATLSIATIDDVSLGHLTWIVLGVANDPNADHDLFLEIGQEAPPAAPTTEFLNIHSDDAGPIFKAENTAGVAGISFFNFGAGGTATPVKSPPAAIAAPSGGATVDTQARAAIVALIDLFSAAAGGYGLTA